MGRRLFRVETHDVACNRESKSEAPFTQHHNLGFNHDFNALEVKGRPRELNEAFTELLHSSQASRYALHRLVQSMIPILRSLV
jgi:hypothetical protein